MKRLLPALLFLILTAPLCFCLDNFQFSIAPRMSFTFGELNEILYASDDTIVSQLDWEEKALFDIGLSSNVVLNNFILGAAFDYSIPAGTSYMYDSDWEDGKKYSLTEHPIKKSINLSSEISAAYKIHVNQKISVLPQLKFDYFYNDFEADKGSGWRNGRDIKVYGIDYKRHSFFIFTGLALNIDFNQLFSLSTDFALAPWGYQYSFDHHHGVKHPFSTEGIQYSLFTKYKADINADFHITSLFTLQSFTNLIFGFPDKGSISSDYSSTSMEEDKTHKSGSAINAIRTGIAVIFSL